MCCKLIFIFNTFLVPLENVISPRNTAVNQGYSAVMSCEFRGTGISGVTWISPSGSELHNNPPSVTISESGLLMCTTGLQLWRFLMS